jgi:predicted anti-sigma-YlaC factor YlaD
VLKCRDMAELVTSYLENALPLKTWAAARFHLWLCGSCRRYVDQMRRTIRFLSNRPERPPPETLTPENEDRIIGLLMTRRPDD